MTKSEISLPADRGDSTHPWKFQDSKKPKRTKKDGTPRKPRRGWGPYRSVPNERAVAFNLQLDVQNLQQQVHNLTSLRDLLQTKILHQRHSPEGSLCRVVNEYFRVFRKGVVLQGHGSKRLVDDRYRDQRAFMHSVMDEEVDLGHVIFGPDVMMEQMARYSLFLRFICMAGTIDSIVVADDSVMVKYKGTLQFQVLRSTIEMIFPHIIGNEWLVSKLVGKLVEAPGHSIFHFNKAGKCFKYDIDMDFVAAFMNVVNDPKIVDILLGRALITDNAMIGDVDAVYELDDKEKVAPAALTRNAYSERDFWEPEDEEKAPAPNSREDDLVNTGSCSKELNPSECWDRSPCSAREFCQQAVENIVEDYFYAFANGYQDDAELPSQVTQSEFVVEQFAAQMQAGVKTTVNCVKQRWRALGECFEVLSFQQKGVTQTVCDRNGNVCQVHSSAVYVLRITFYTIQSVFPHLVSNMPLLDLLVGKVIVVPSELTFCVEKSTGTISHVSESMDFAAAIAELLPDKQDLSYVVSRALLARDGVKCGRWTQSPRFATSSTQEPPTQPSQVHEKQQRSTTRTISMADILN